MRSVVDEKSQARLQTVVGIMCAFGRTTFSVPVEDDSSRLGPETISLL